MKPEIRKMKIAVLYGGPSSEREVSLKSGAAVITALKNLGVKKIFPIIVNRDARWITKLSSEKPDFVFIALHGKYGEDGTVQSVLEFLGIPYCGSRCGASFLAMNKLYTKKIFRSEGLPIPPGFTARRPDTPSENSRITEELYKQAIKKLGDNVVIKPIDEGSAVGVSLVGKSFKDFQKALKLAWKFSPEAIVEKYIPGVEITVGILDGKALVPIEIIPRGKFYDYKSKYGANMSTHIIPPTGITPETQTRCRSLALKAFKALDCRAFARVDMRVTSDGKIYLLEVNTIPGLTSTSLLPDAAKYEGIDFEALIEKMILSSMTR